MRWFVFSVGCNTAIIEAGMQSGIESGSTGVVGRVSCRSGLPRLPFSSVLFS